MAFVDADSCCNHGSSSPSAPESLVTPPKEPNGARAASPCLPAAPVSFITTVVRIAPDPNRRSAGDITWERYELLTARVPRVRAKHGGLQSLGRRPERGSSEWQGARH